MQVAVLSPHRDDAAFSCGLTLRAMLAAGSSLTIVNVCTVSRYAPYLTEYPADVMERVTELRRGEDAAFVETLRHSAGAQCGQVEVVDLAWQDVPVRWCMEDHLALAPRYLPKGEVHKLADAFRALPRFDVVLVPMALGGHIDHRLVLEAAREALPAASLVFYEDLPYACRLSASERTSAEYETGIPLSAILLPRQGAIAGRKREYALHYPSQISNEVAEEIEHYASGHGGRERFLAGAHAMRMLRPLRHETVV